LPTLENVSHEADDHRPLSSNVAENADLYVICESGAVKLSNKSSYQ
jgi:hypothetical protein